MKHLAQLCTDLEISPDLEKSKEGSFLLPITEELTLEIKELSPAGVYFYSPICPCPEVKLEELFILLMKANLYGQGTRGATIGLDSEGKLLTLAQDVSYDLDYRTFKATLEDFANIVDYWREEIGRHIEQAKGGII